MPKLRNLEAGPTTAPGRGLLVPDEHDVCAKATACEPQDRRRLWDDGSML